MSLQLKNVTVGSTSKKPIFETITIIQGQDGRMSASGAYRIEVVSDSDQSTISSIGLIPFVIGHDDLVTNPDFAAGYRILRDLARSGLQSAAPEFVAPAPQS
jgi:hypothetical protein